MFSRIFKSLPIDDKYKELVEFIGLITGLTTIVTLFCSLLVDIDTIDITVITICTIFISTALFKFTWIKTNIPSPALAILLFGLFAVFYLKYKDIIRKKTGLIEYSKASKSIIGKLPEYIDNSVSEIIFYGANFHISVVDDETEILRALSRGVTIKYLVYNPYAENINLVARDFRQSTAEYFNECQQGLRALVSLRKKWESQKIAAEKMGELDIRLYEAFPRMRAYIFDPKDQQSVCLYIPYLHNVNSTDLPSFLFRNLKSGVFNDYYSSIVSLWGVSVRIDDVAKNNVEIEKLIQE